MFNGLKKIVGSAMGSSEFLDTSSHDIGQSDEYSKKHDNDNVVTPYQKEKKRKHDYGNSTKKK